MYRRSNFSSCRVLTLDRSSGVGALALEPTRIDYRATSETLNPHPHAKTHQQFAIASPQNCGSDAGLMGLFLERTVTTVQRYFKKVEANLSGLNLLLIGSIVVPKKAWEDEPNFNSVVAESADTDGRVQP